MKGVLHLFKIFHRPLIYVTALTFCMFSFGDDSKTYRPCSHDPARLKLRSQELLNMAKEDQKDRRGDWGNKTPQELQTFLWRDLKRRKRVGEIFGEGCFTKAKDYSSAAMIFQHGDSPDHFWQTFTWSKKAMEMGDNSSKGLMVMGLDRYLSNIGHKQLFGSQAIKEKNCWCLLPVEKTFPDKKRKEFLGKSLRDSLNWIKSLNKGSSKCPSKECDQKLKATPRGFVPGFW